MAKTPIHTLDLKFQGRPGAIAAYLIEHSSGVVLVECGPGSTLEAMKSALATHGFTPKDVTHLLVTHIHLDHAGAAGWFARQGSQVFVHPVGAPHMLNPDKLLASAGRIYGDRMHTLWGDFLSVPEENLTILEDGDQVQIGRLEILALDTPGHAEHHHAYLFEDTLFSGDIGGVRMQGFQYLRLPMPPPELHIKRWQASIKRLKTEKFSFIAPTHFGIFDDPQWHLDELQRGLATVEAWLDQKMPADPPLEVLREDFTRLMEEEARAAGIDESAIRAFEVANPVGMSADGLQRYWRKHRVTT